MQRAATSLLFGIDFQTNAAIVLMLENIKEMSTIRVEGEEDIEIQLNDGSYVLAQAKSVVDSSTVFSNVRSKAKKAVTTLSEAAEKLKVRELIYITNSPNPFNDDASKPQFCDDAHVRFEKLPQTTKELVEGWFEGIKKPLDTSKFKIQVLPFETDDDKQRYKVVLRDISDFIGDIGIDADGLRKRLHEVWTNALTKNGSRKKTSIKLHKKAIVWPIIVFVTGKGKLNRDAHYCDILDDGEYDEVCRKYGEIIDDYSERFDFATKVVSDYSLSGLKGRESIKTFIDVHWEEYKNELGTASMDDGVRCSLIKIILFNILNKRFDIDRIKCAVNL